MFGKKKNKNVVEPNLDVEEKDVSDVASQAISQINDITAQAINQISDMAVSQDLSKIYNVSSNEKDNLQETEEPIPLDILQKPEGLEEEQEEVPTTLIVEDNKDKNKDENVAKKTRYKYQVMNSQGEKVSGYFDAYSESEVKAYLENEGYEIVKIEVSKDIIIGGTKLNYSELSFMLTQLSTYLKAGIPLIDSVRILEKQSVKPIKRRIFSNITYELVKGESFSSALASQGNVFPTFLINMVKTAEMTGDLPAALDDMNNYYSTIDKTRREAISAMTYPIIVFIFAIAVIFFILTYVVPTFVGIFEQANTEIPTLTKIVISTSDFLVNNWPYLMIGILVVLIVYVILFKYVKSFRKAMQTFMMKLPVVGNIIIYKEVAMFTKTFASLLNHSVFITDSMKILGQVTTNEVYTEIIDDSLKYLSRGAKISDSFKGKWAFPVIAYEMLVTGENTGRLAMMMENVATYYDDMHSNSVKRINTLIEPFMIIFLAVIVGIVVLAVVVPMFGMYSAITK